MSKLLAGLAFSVFVENVPDEVQMKLRYLKKILNIFSALKFKMHHIFMQAVTLCSVKLKNSGKR